MDDHAGIPSADTLVVRSEFSTTDTGVAEDLLRRGYIAEIVEGFRRRCGVHPATLLRQARLRAPARRRHATVTRPGSR